MSAHATCGQNVMRSADGSPSDNCRWKTGMNKRQTKGPWTRVMMGLEPNTPHLHNDTDWLCVGEPDCNATWHLTIKKKKKSTLDFAWENDEGIITGKIRIYNISCLLNNYKGWTRICFFGLIRFQQTNRGKKKSIATASLLIAPQIQTLWSICCYLLKIP